jgi:hypothetical protein
MIPDFDDRGCLPPGIHPASILEIHERFGIGSEIRQVQFESLQWMVERAWRAGAKRIILNGSWVTDVFEPNDVDCVILVDEAFPLDRHAERDLLEVIPFVLCELVRQRIFDLYVERFFATDRRAHPKGMVELIR